MLITEEIMKYEEIKMDYSMDPGLRWLAIPSHVKQIHKDPPALHTIKDHLTTYQNICISIM